MPARSPCRIFAPHTEKNRCCNSAILFYNKYIRVSSRNAAENLPFHDRRIAADDKHYSYRTQLCLKKRLTCLNLNAKIYVHSYFSCISLHMHRCFYILNIKTARKPYRFRKRFKRRKFVLNSVLFVIYFTQQKTVCPTLLSKLRAIS